MTLLVPVPAMNHMRCSQRHLPRHIATITHIAEIRFVIAQRQPLGGRQPQQRCRRRPQRIELRRHRYRTPFQPLHPQVDHGRRGQRHEGHRHQQPRGPAQLLRARSRPFPDCKHQPHHDETDRHRQEPFRRITHQKHGRSTP